MLNINNKNLNIELFEGETKFPNVVYVESENYFVWQSRLSDFLIHYPTICGKIYKTSTVSPKMDIRITFSGNSILNYDLILGEVLDQVNLKLINTASIHSVIKILDIDESIKSSEHNKNGGGSVNLENLNLNSMPLSNLLIALLKNSNDWHFENIDQKLLKTRINLEAQIPKNASILQLSQILNKIGIKNKIIQRNHFFTIGKK